MGLRKAWLALPIAIVAVTAVATPARADGVFTSYSSTTLYESSQILQVCDTYPDNRRAGGSVYNYGSGGYAVGYDANGSNPTSDCYEEYVNYVGFEYGDLYRVGTWRQAGPSGTPQDEFFSDFNF